MATTRKASQPLVVVVSGGGPVGLTFSLHLTMMMGKQVKIIIYEGRWFVDKQGKTRWQSEEQGKIRRDQVVTLQDHVIKQMPEYIQKGLFKNINECVWPTSRNIPIREVEDRLFDLIQPFVQTGQIELIPENLHEQSECLIKGNFDVLVGADGSTSFVRKYCNIQMISEGMEYACGVAYKIPDQVAPSDEPLHQALNCILTISQTRYLVNSSTSRRGYLNIRLIQNEYDELRERLQVLQSLNEPLDLLDYNKCPQSPVWQIIRQGLEFFKISPKYVFRVVPIEINVRHASIVVRELRFEINNTEQNHEDPGEKQYKTALAFLAGDAAMNVHFWPGRGMNSGMKAAMALARNILRSCTSNNSIQIRTPLRFLDFLDYEGFMARLRAREQQGRSLRVLINPIDKYIEASYSYIYLSHCYTKYTNKLIEKLKETRARLEERPEWPHQSRQITDGELQSASNRISPQAVAQLSLANPWPTREMSGIEVLTEDIFPYDLKNFLPVPTRSSTNVERAPTVIIRHSFLTLWIIGDKQIESIDNLIQHIQKSQNFATSSTNTGGIHQLTVVQTAEEAKQWIKSNQELIRKPDIRFKVVTVWSIKDGETAVDVIRAVRSESPRVPILIFTNKREETQAALEFPNVLATDEEFELKEFVGAQETQWSAGCRVQSQIPPPPPVTITPKSPGSSPLPYPITDSPAIPPLPDSRFPSIPSSTSSRHSSLTSTSLRSPQLKPMLLWIDAADNDPRATSEIQRSHPTLEINFVPTYKDAETYLNQHAREIDEREKFIIICRGYYAAESKSFADVARIFGNCNHGTLRLGVYTKSRTALLERIANPAQGIDIFEIPKDLLDFVDRHMNQ